MENGETQKGDEREEGMKLLVLRGSGGEKGGWEWPLGWIRGWTFEHEQDLSVREWVRWDQREGWTQIQEGSLVNISFNEN